MRNELVYGVITFSLGIAQILRVRLFNELTKPYFVVGLRKGIFMNGVALFVNILAPFRVGEIIRYLFLANEINSPKVLIFSAIIFERTLDLIAILSLAVIFKNYLEQLFLTIGLATLIIVTLLILIRFVNFQKIFGTNFIFKNNVKTNLFLIISYFKNTSLKKLRNILTLQLLIWSLYLLIAKLLSLITPVTIGAWLKWNVAPYRGSAFINKINEVYNVLNFIYIIPVLLIGVTLSLAPHINLPFFDKIVGGDSDSSKSGNLNSKFPFGQKIKLKIFFQNPTEYYFKKLKTRKSIVKLFNGGSGAVVYQDNEGLKNNEIVKVAFGIKAKRLESQFNFMENSKSDWNFVNVYEGKRGFGFFQYKMRIIDSLTSPVDFLCENIEFGILHEEMFDEIYNYIDPLEKITHESNIDLKGAKQNLNILWNDKVLKTIKELKLTSPEYFVTKQFSINNKKYPNLENLTNLLSLKISRLRGFKEKYEIHGDPSLSNLFYDRYSGAIIGIDPNPDNLYKSVVVDHGKILQSIWGLYELLIKSGEIKYQTLSSIVYECPIPDSFNSTLQYYKEKFILDQRKLLYSEIMCFIAFIRLLPYRVQLDRSNSGMFFAKAIEIGTYIESLNWDILDE